MIVVPHKNPFLKTAAGLIVFRCSNDGILVLAIALQVLSTQGVHPGL